MAAIPTSQIRSKLLDLTTVSLYELRSMRTPLLDEAILGVAAKLSDGDSVQEQRR